MGADGVLLRATGVRYNYGTDTVLRGVDLELAAGEMVALLGPNGAGKTTFMRTVVGLLRPRGGSVDGPHRSQIGWVPQGGAVWQRLTVRENLALFARLLHLRQPADVAVQAAREADLEPWLDHACSDLSGGLRQRLNVVVGLLGSPRLIVLDEPTTGVDLHHRVAMFRVLRQRADSGSAVLYSTHSLEDGAAADRAVVLAGGEARFSGPIDQLAAHARPDEHPTLDARSRGLLALWGAREDQPA